MQIRVDDLRGPEIIELLHEHLRCMERVSPPESRHALDLDGLRKPEITFLDRLERDGAGGLRRVETIEPTPWRS